MPTAIITGAAGLVGAEAVRFFASREFQVVGIDNDQRSVFFGAEASTSWSRDRLLHEVPGYDHRDIDIRDESQITEIFAEFSSDIAVVIHAAAQPSHDWAAGFPQTDFTVNAVGTLNLLEACRLHCPRAAFIFTSTNKVYGDTPNRLPLVEHEMRWELDPSHPYFSHGIDETMSVDQTTHSLFGVSKLAADALVQEFGRYWGMNTVCFRCGCLTGSGHSSTMLHGFLAYLVKCAVRGDEYTMLGYKGKQVRDNLHSWDLVNMFWSYCQQPRPGEVYNAGGGRFSNCSIIEAIELCQKILGRRMKVNYTEQNRIGDHLWYISDTRKFQQHYPSWKPMFGLPAIMEEIGQSLLQRCRTS